jgi:hypothetical protein
MSVIIQGSQVREILLGFKVEEPAAVLPATGIAHLFTVAGGRVIVTGLIGQCTVVNSATATTVSVGVTPTTGTATATSLATATAITSKEVGTLASLGATPGAALVVGANAGGAVGVQGNNGSVVEPGTIDITTSATNTGAWKWTLFYIPLDDGAAVTAV